MRAGLGGAHHKNFAVIVSALQQIGIDAVPIETIVLPYPYHVAVSLV